MKNRRITRVLLLVLIVVVVVSHFFLRSVISPLAVITEKSKRIANGSYGVQIQPKYRDEIGELAMSMNIMSQKLEKTISELKTANYELKKDIENKECRRLGLQAADLVHDLRAGKVILPGPQELSKSVACDNFAFGKVPLTS